MPYSKTAIGAACQRYVHALVDAPPPILDDPVVGRLLGPDAERRVREGLEGFRSEESARLRSALLLRARFAEDLVEAERPAQYLILGAGLDTYAYRRGVGSAMRIFEVDAGESQEYKRSALSRAGIAVPGCLRFASVDFETDRLEEALSAAGLDFGAKTVISWLGVLAYLSREAAESVLRSLAANFRDAVLVLSFAPKRSGRGLAERRASMAGEVWKSKYDEEGILALMAGCGFVDCAIPERDEIRERYFADRKDRLACPDRIALATGRTGASLRSGKRKME